MRLCVRPPAATSRNGSIEPGDTAAPGQPVFEIVQMDPVEVNVGVPETDVHLVRIGQKAEITVPALPGKSFQGTVRVINVSADPNTRTYMTRISVAESRALPARRDGSGSNHPRGPDGIHGDASGGCGGTRSAGSDAGVRLLPRPEARIHQARGNRSGSQQETSR